MYSIVFILYTYFSIHSDTFRVDLDTVAKLKVMHFRSCYATSSHLESAFFEALMKKHIDRAKVELGKGGSDLSIS